MVKWEVIKTESLEPPNILPAPLAKALVIQRIWPMICLFHWLVLLSADYWICYRVSLPCQCLLQSRGQNQVLQEFTERLLVLGCLTCLCWREFSIKPIMIAHRQKQVVVRRIYNVYFSLVSNYYWYFPKESDSYGEVHYIWSLYKASITSEAYGQNIVFLFSSFHTM